MAPGTSSPRPFSDDLADAKAASTMQLLFRCARLANEDALRRVRDATGKHVRPSHTTLFPHIDLAGTRMTVLATRLGISKQAVGQLVHDLQEMQMVEVIPDPRDGRARLVRFSKRGRRGLIEGVQILKDLEDELARSIGHNEMKQLHRILTRLMPLLEDNAGKAT